MSFFTGVSPHPIHQSGLRMAVFYLLENAVMSHGSPLAPAEAHFYTVIVRERSRGGHTGVGERAGDRERAWLEVASHCLPPATADFSAARQPRGGFACSAT